MNLYPFREPSNIEDALRILKDDESSEAELVYAVGFLTKRKHTSKQLREYLNVSSAQYISYLRNIAKNIDDNLYQVWHRNSGRIKISHMRAIVRHPKKHQEDLLREAISKGLSSHRLEFLLTSEDVDVQFEQLEEEVSQSIGQPVKIIAPSKDAGGKLILNWYSLEECEGLLEKLGHRFDYE